MNLRNTYALIVVLLMSGPAAAQAVDADAALSLARQNNCLKCHSINKAKDGPAYSAVAARYKGKPDAEAKLMKHITTAPKVKLEDGSEEDHPMVKTKDEAQLRNLVRWILSL